MTIKPPRPRTRREILPNPPADDAGFIDWLLCYGTALSWKRWYDEVVPRVNRLKGARYEEASALALRLRTERDYHAKRLPLRARFNADNLSVTPAHEPVERVPDE